MTHRFIMYWEQVDKSVPVPPHIQACIDIMRRRYGDLFVLHDETSIKPHLDVDLDHKNWNFGVPGNDELERKKLSVVAKSDFVRLRYMYHHGGVWVDSDALNVGDANRIYDLLSDHPVAWGYEAFFAARPGQKVLKTASDNMLDLPCQIWGNPGRIKDLLKSDPTLAHPIPADWLEPLTKHGYNWHSTEMLLRTDIQPSAFLSPSQIFLHLYNKSFWQRTPRGEEMTAAIEGGVDLASTLIGKIAAAQGVDLARFRPPPERPINGPEPALAEPAARPVQVNALSKCDRLAESINFYVAGFLTARDSHVGIIGNIYYSHDVCRDRLHDLIPADYWLHKRERVLRLARRREDARMLEVGINAGHSAAIALLANDRLQYTGVDNAAAYFDGQYTIRSDLYVPACMELLATLFPGRTSWHRGNSVDMLRALCVDPANKERFNILHLDAAKHLYYDDFLTALPMLADECTVIIDDTSTEQDTANITLRRLVSEGFLALDEEFPEVRASAICRLIARA